MLQNVFGDDFLTKKENTHVCAHLAHTTCMNGPLRYAALFPWESHLGRMHIHICVLFHVSCIALSRRIRRNSNGHSVAKALQEHVFLLKSLQLLQNYSTIREPDSSVRIYKSCIGSVDPIIQYSDYTSRRLNPDQIQEVHLLSAAYPDLFSHRLISAAELRSITSFMVKRDQFRIGNFISLDFDESKMLQISSIYVPPRNYDGDEVYVVGHVFVYDENSNGMEEFCFGDYDSCVNNQSTLSVWTINDESNVVKQVAARNPAGTLVRICSKW